MKKLAVSASRVLTLALSLASCDSSTGSDRVAISGRWRFVIPPSRYGILDIQQSGSALSGTGTYENVSVAVTGTYPGPAITLQIGPVGESRSLVFTGAMENDSTLRGTWSGSFAGSSYSNTNGVLLR